MLHHRRSRHNKDHVLPKRSTMLKSISCFVSESQLFIQANNSNKLTVLLLYFCNVLLYWHQPHLPQVVGFFRVLKVEVAELI